MHRIARTPALILFLAAASVHAGAVERPTQPPTITAPLNPIQAVIEAPTIQLWVNKAGDAACNSSSVTYAQGQVISEGQIWLSLKPPAGDLPVNKARIRLERVGGGLLKEFDMDFNYSQGLSAAIMNVYQGDCVYPKSVYGTYRITAKVGSSSVQAPAKAAEKTFEIGAKKGQMSLPSLQNQTGAQRTPPN